MLRSMRTGAQSWFIKIFLFGMLLLATVGLALMDYRGMFSGHYKSNIVAEIGGEKLTLTEFDTLLQGAMRRQKMKPADAYKSGYPAEYLQNEINNRLLRNVVRDYGIVVSDEAAAKQIKAILASFPVKGVSDKEALQNLLYNLGVSERTLVENQKVDIGLNLLMRALTAGMQAPEQMTTDAMKYQAESRRAEYFTINAADADKSEKPSDDELQVYYKKIADRFMLPEYRTLAVLAIDAKSLVNTAPPTEDDLRAHYDANKSNFAVGETRSVSQIVVQDEKDAQAFYDEAKANGGDLKKVADAHKGKVTYVKASAYNESDAPGEISAAFKAQEGALLEPVKSPLGSIIAKVEKIVPAHERPYEEVKEQVKADLEGQRADDNAEAVYKRANEIEDMVAGGKSLADVAAELKLHETVLTAVDAQGNSPDGKKLETKIPAFDKALAAGFRLKEGGVSERIETPTGEFLLVEAREITPAEERPFDKVKADVLKAWQAEKHSAALDQLSAKILDRLKLGEDFEGVAKSFGKKVTRTEMILRSDHAKAASMAQGMFPSLFALEKVGQVTVVGGGESATILRLAERAIDEKRVPKEEDVKNVRNMLDHAVQKDLLEQFRMSLMAKYDVEIHEKVLQEQYKDKDDGDDSGTGSN